VRNHRVLLTREEEEDGATFRHSTPAKDATLQRTDVNVLKQVCT
jgi:hypothetical protein